MSRSEIIWNINNLVAEVKELQRKLRQANGMEPKIQAKIAEYRRLKMVLASTR